MSGRRQALPNSPKRISLTLTLSHTLISEHPCAPNTLVSYLCAIPATVAFESARLERDTLNRPHPPRLLRALPLGCTMQPACRVPLDLLAVNLQTPHAPRGLYSPGHAAGPQRSGGLPKERGQPVQAACEASILHRGSCNDPGALPGERTDAGRPPSAAGRVRLAAGGLPAGLSQRAEGVGKRRQAACVPICDRHKHCAAAPRRRRSRRPQSRPPIDVGGAAAGQRRQPRWWRHPAAAPRGLRHGVHQRQGGCWRRCAAVLGGALPSDAAFRNATPR